MLFCIIYQEHMIVQMGVGALVEVRGTVLGDCPHHPPGVFGVFLLGTPG